MWLDDDAALHPKIPEKRDRYQISYYRCTKTCISERPISIKSLNAEQFEQAV